MRARYRKMLWVLAFGLLLVAAEYALAITSRSHPENARQTEFGAGVEDVVSEASPEPNDSRASSHHVR